VAIDKARQFLRIERKINFYSGVFGEFWQESGYPIAKSYFSIQRQIEGFVSSETGICQRDKAVRHEG
jgi:hypothetical protein